ncbi:MAG: SLBB domain-containing protein, partial [Deltaproteobacteria bacterium]|nr:SLBB domain-containing protein [Deltaproteobacteria bacterium]
PVDLNRLLKDGDMTQNVLLKPGDTIVIPRPSKEITILGEVNQPGRYKVKQRTTLLDALAVAGGLKREVAALDIAYVARHNSILPVNFKRLIDMGDMGQNILLNDKDIINIPSNRENKFIMGEVRNPGVLRFLDPMDVIEAISEAGGFLTTANRKQVVVVRGGLQEPKVYAVDALQMMKGMAREKFTLRPTGTYLSISYFPLLTLPMLSKD